MTRKLSEYALWAALPMAHTSKVEGRITMILDTTRRRTTPRRALIFSIAIGAAALVPLAMLRPAAKAQPASSAAGTVQLAWVADASKPSGTAWDRNGNLLRSGGFPGLQESDPKISAPTGQKALFVAFRIPGAMQDSPRIVVNGSDAPLGRIRMTSANGAVVTAFSFNLDTLHGVTAYAAGFPAALPSANFQVGVASRQGTETVDCPKTIGKVHLSGPAGDAIFTLLPHSQGGAVFMVSDHFRRASPLSADNPLQVALHDGENYDRSVYALDKSGKVLAKLLVTPYTWPDAMGAAAQSYRSIKTQQTGHLSSALLQHTASFRLVARPYQWTEFKNVALQPSSDAAAYAVLAAPSEEPALSAADTQFSQKEALRLSQAQQLRSHLTNWAQANKAALVQMQQARPDDLASLMRVYDSLIKQPFPLWDGDPRVGRAASVISSYLPDPAFSTQTVALTLSHLERSQEPIDRSLREDFARYHDFRIACSTDPGRNSIVVWASGRITQSTVSDKFMGHGKPILLVTSEKPIIPPFFP